MKTNKGTCSGPTFQPGDGRIAVLGDRQEVQARLAAKWDCRLVSSRTEVASQWDNERRKLVKPVNHLVVTFERNTAAAVGREDVHFEELWRVIHAEVAKIPEDAVLSIVLNDSDGKSQFFIPRGYVQAAYEVCTLGKFRKASPAVEALIQEEGVSC